MHRPGGRGHQWTGQALRDRNEPMASKLKRDEKTVSARLDERTRFALEWVARGRRQTTVNALTEAIQRSANDVQFSPEGYLPGNIGLTAGYVAMIADEFPEDELAPNIVCWDHIYDPLEPIRVLRPLMFMLWSLTPDEHLLRQFVEQFSKEVGWKPRDRQRLARTWPLQELAADWSTGELTDAQVCKELDKRAKATKAKRP